MTAAEGPGVWGWQPDGRVHPLSPTSEEGMWYQACIHPEGGHAVFWGGRLDDIPRIWRCGTSGDDTPEPLTDDANGARHPAYGARGDRIVFTSDRASGGAPARRSMREENPTGRPPNDRAWNLFSMAPDGSGVEQVTTGDHVDERPALSPDGERIAFVSSRGPGIWTVDRTGGALRRLTDRPLYRPWWSIDGRAIFCFLLTPSDRQVGLLDVATGEWSPLANDDRGNTHGPYADLRGDRLLAHSDRAGRWGLWEIPLDRSPMAKLVPPGFEGRTVGHGTRARNGEITFDSVTMRA